jgi:hypothetical protein
MRSNKAGSTMAVSYYCASCYKVRRRLDRVDRVVNEAIVKRLLRSDAPDLFGGDQVALTAALERAQAIRTRLNGAADQFADGAIDGEQLALITARLRPQLADAEREAEAARPADPAFRALVAAHDDGEEHEKAVRGRWNDAALDVKRAVVRQLLTVTIESVGPGKNFDASSVRCEWLSPTLPN